MVVALVTKVIQFLARTRISLKISLHLTMRAGLLGSPKSPIFRPEHVVNSNNLYTYRCAVGHHGH